jgi:phage-related minor tail protein
VLRVFHGDFHAVETPALELLKQPRAAIRKRRREEKSVNAKVHILIGSWKERVG